MGTQVILFTLKNGTLKTFREQLEQRINSGTTLVLDRYAPSGVAYSSAKGLELDWCKAPDNGLPKPDLVIFLDVPVQSTTNRAGFGEERYERLDFQILVRKRFEELWDDSWVVSWLNFSKYLMFYIVSGWNWNDRRGDPKSTTSCI